MMAVAFGPASCSSGLVLKSKLLHSPEAQSGFVPKHSPHGGKNIALRAKKQKTRRQEDKTKVFMVFSSEDVLHCEAMCGAVVAGA